MMILKEKACGGESNVVEYRYSGDRVRREVIRRQKAKMTIFGNATAAWADPTLLDR